MMIAKVRLYLNAAQTALFLEGDPEGATLYCAAGDEIPDSAVELFGLVDGTLPEKDAAEEKADGEKAGGKGRGKTKEARPRPNKEKEPGEGSGDKSGDKSGQNDAGTATDDLTKVRGIGSTSAAKFVAAGITTIAQIAAIDPANPPAVEGLSALVKWADLVESAKALVAPVDNQDGGVASGDGGAGTGDAGQQS